MASLGKAAKRLTAAMAASQLTAAKAASQLTAAKAASQLTTVKAANRLTAATLTKLSRAAAVLGGHELRAARHELARMRGELAHLASHDRLTSLPNRAQIEREIDQSITACTRSGRPSAVIILDIDAFKYINDSRGHAVGDQVLVSVSRLMRSALRPHDLLGRLGGDEFAAVVVGADRGSAEDLVDRMLEALRRKPIIVDGGRPVRVTASVGMAFLDPRSPQSSTDLLIEADVAMSHAKGAGRNRLTLYSATDPGQADLHRRHTWVNRIEDALDSNLFTLHAQPVLDLGTDRVDRYELLLRMTDADGSLIMPNAFLPTAERTGLITRIDHWVITEACRMVGEHQRAGDRPHFEVNLSGASMGDPAILDVIERGLAELPHPSGLVIEVTETAAIIDIARARTFADRLESLGCEFALDDFGAGYGSFYYLKHLPFDYLKIDGEFIRGLATNRADQVLVRSLVQIGEELGKRTVAEFVEDDATLAMVRELGVDFAQGYHIGRPAQLPPPDLPSPLVA